MRQFDEIIPYDRQSTAKIFSPRMLNMMLICGPQIEAVVNLIAKRCKIEQTEVDEECNNKTKPVSIKKLIGKINEKCVLSRLQIISNHGLLFTPFTLHLEWWDSYNGLKHGLTKRQFKIDYTTVMNTLAALTGLHHLANALMVKNDVSEILDEDNWFEDLKQVPKLRGLDPFVKPFTTLLFKIKNHYIPAEVR